MKETGKARRNIIAVGTSAGGLNALSRVLSVLPTDMAAALLVVQHLDPKHKSFMADILQRRSAMRVTEGVDGAPIEDGSVYVAPPDLHMTVRSGSLHLSSEQPVRFSRPSVDVLFQSVAEYYGRRVLAIVLTGSGTDGAAGVRAVKEHGGYVIVQDPVSAESTGMPWAAITTGCVDRVVPLEEIGEAVVAAVAQED